MIHSLKRFGQFVAGIGAMLLISSCSVFGVRTVEEAGYSVIRKDGAFELRQYDSMIVAETWVKGDYDKAGNTAFRRLFKYITGNNQAKQKIAMTAPVIGESADKAAGEKIAMTAPVMQEASEEGWRFCFVMPATMTLDTTPEPLDSTVTIREIPGKKVAAVRYSGSWSHKLMMKHVEKLEAWLAEEGIEATSISRSAGYDPPWTVPMRRRNEVLIDVSAAAE